MMYQSLFPRDTIGQAIQLNKPQQWPKNLNIPSTID
jgi:hypothetical protein